MGRVSRDLGAQLEEMTTGDAEKGNKLKALCFLKERKENNVIRKVQWVIKNDAASGLHRFFYFADPSSTDVLLKGDTRCCQGTVVITVR